EMERGAMLKKYATLDDVYVALGREDLRIEQVLECLLPLLSLHNETTREEETTLEGRRERTDQENEEEQTNTIKLAHCCHPIPGDTIVGLFSTLNRGISVHRNDCRTFDRHRDNPNALVEVSWSRILPESYLA